MSETKFTKGDWQVHFEVTLTGYPCFFINGMSGDEKRDQETLTANCNLIEAAPTMDEAIDYTLDLLWSNDVTKTVGMAERSVFDKLKAAQKKARGEHETD